MGATVRATSLVAAFAVAARVLLTPTPARGQAAPPAGHEDAAFDFMNLLSHNGMHDIDNESWNAYGQSTYIGSYKAPMHAPYTNTNTLPAPLVGPYSLVPGGEYSFTATLTGFFGLRLWPGAEVYFTPEVISEQALSNLHGIGGAIQNFELQKQGSTTPQVYRSRTYLRQTIDFGGARVEKESDPMQLATVVGSRRLVFTAGNFSILDVFDRNGVSWDPHRTLMNMAFMTYSSWDFPSDARGYSWGATAELYWDDWAFRIGRITPPQTPNALPIDFRFWLYYGDEIEIEHDHVLLGQAGAVRLLGYRNHVFTARFDDAIATFQADPSKNGATATATGGGYGSLNANAPDVYWARKPNEKFGIGVDLEQHVTEDIGFFLRAMYSDGNTEVDAFNPADRSLSFGAIAKGPAWHRPFDVTGIGYGISWISDAHARYLGMGGIDGFIGDGAIHQAAEGVFEGFYSVNLLKAIWLSADYQLLYNPAFNADRGPASIFGGRVHAEF